MNILALCLLPFSTFMLFEIVKSIAFFPIPSRLPCVIVPLLAWLLLTIPVVFSISLTAAFGVIVLHKIIQVPSSAPVAVPWAEGWDACVSWCLRLYDTVCRRRPRSVPVDLPPGVGNRIPDV